LALTADKSALQGSLEHKPDINAAVLGAGAIAIARRREKAVMATGGGVRVIIAILDHRIVTALVVMVHFRVRDGVVVTMFIGLLVVLVMPVVRPVLRVSRRWYARRHCEREQTEHERL
jgi:hypothetical protein